MSYSARAHEAGGWDKIEPRGEPHPGNMRCDQCDQETMTRHLHGSQWICPTCFKATDMQLEATGQLTFAPDICVEEAA